MDRSGYFDLIGNEIMIHSQSGICDSNVHTCAFMNNYIYQAVMWLIVLLLTDGSISIVCLHANLPKACMNIWFMTYAIDTNIYLCMCMYLVPLAYIRQDQEGLGFAMHLVVRSLH